jgi:fibro-slime domain-containing protein
MPRPSRTPFLLAAAFAPALVAAAVVAACGSSSSNSQFQDAGGGGTDGSTDGLVASGDGSDGASTSDGSLIGNFDGSVSDAGMGGDCSPNLTGRLRDFVNKPGFTPASALDDDFENATGDDRGIVATDLGPTGKPVYANPSGTTPTTHGQTQFDWWYRDTPGKNQPFDYTITLTPIGDGGVSSFDNQEFFPLDGRGWNDEYVADDGNMHNFSFTFELHTTFEYMGGEVFTFIGDDDVFVFIDKKLVVDLGGVHGAETKAITLDTLATDDSAATPVPLTKGTTYPLDIFYNERHTVSSHFRMDTSIAFNNCNPIIIPQ